MVCIHISCQIFLVHVTEDLILLHIKFPSMGSSFQLACNGSCPGPADGISPIYSLWATFIGIYIANYVVERSTGSVVACIQLFLSLFDMGINKLVNIVSSVQY